MAIRSNAITYSYVTEAEKSLSNVTVIWAVLLLLLLLLLLEISRILTNISNDLGLDFTKCRETSRLTEESLFLSKNREL